MVRLDYKKIIITLLIVAVAGVTIYFIWGGVAGPETTGPAASPSASSTLPGGLSLPATGTSTAPAGVTNTISFPSDSDPVFKVSDQPVSGYWIDPQTEGIFYLNGEGKVFLINKNKNGEDTEIVKQGAGALNSIEVGPNSQKILAAFGDPRSPQWGIFDDIDQTWRPLPGTVLNATWGENNGVLYGIVQNGNVPALASIDISKSDVSTKILIKDFRFQDVRLSFLPPSTLYIIERGASEYSSRVWGVTTSDLSIHPLLDSRNGLILNPSDDRRVFFSFQGNAFHILDPRTLNTVTPIPFLTLPQKCAFGGVITYCFVPNSLNFKNANLPDDYLKSKIFTTDSLYEVNLSNGGTASSDLPKIINNGLFDAVSPKFSKGFLYFINRSDGYLYALNLTSDQFSQAGQNVGD